MRRLRVVTAMLVALAALTAGCASGDRKGGAGSGDVVADRKALMRLQGASFGDMQAKLRAGNVEAAAVNADTLTFTSRHIPGLFPSGSLSEASRAKPEIWQQRDEFESIAKSLNAQATSIAAAARRKDQAAVQTALAELGRTTCTACHDKFRGPEKK